MAALKDWRFWAFVLLALSAAWGLFRLEGAINDINAERVERTRISCEALHQAKADTRRDAIEDFKDIGKFARFFNSTPEDLKQEAAKRLRPKLHGRYGNGRIPSYCPQSKWPEDERKWPAELKGGV